MFRIFQTNHFLANLESHFGPYKNQIKKKLETYVYPQLRSQPYFGPNVKKLRDYEPPIWRYRIGAFRFFYSIDEKNRIVFMLSADNRKNLY